MNIESKIKWWVYPAILWPIIIGIFIISRLSIETQVERFNNDPMGNIGGSILIFGLFFFLPLIPFFFMNTYRLTGSGELEIKNLITRRTKKIQLESITNLNISEGIYGITGSKCFSMKITAKDGTNATIGSKLNNNYDEIAERIIKSQQLT